VVELVRSETTPCLLCGRTTYTPLYTTRDRLCGVPGEFRLVRCACCGLVYLSPRPTPEDIGQYYPEGYDPYMLQRLDDMPPLLRWSVRYGLRKRCRLVRRYRARGRLLDVGCATGQFLAEMAAFSGWEVTGVEPSESAAEFAQVYGFPVHQGDLTSAHFPQGTFDIVTLWDVFEHLQDPLAMLAEVRRILAPDGVLIMRTPSLDSWDARVFGPYWAGLDSPRHLAIFSRHTAMRILDEAGFRLRRFHTGSGSYFACLLSLRFWADAGIARPRRRGLLLSLFGNPVARLALALPLTLTDALGMGSEMMIVAQLCSARQDREGTPH
jgi:2-polyprenyl-3-methyl-5-hydroxy-6-metoxy-1,4-benzoquinol methylase